MFRKVIRVKPLIARVDDLLNRRLCTRHSQVSIFHPLIETHESTHPYSKLTFNQKLRSLNLAKLLIVVEPEMLIMALTFFPLVPVENGTIGEKCR